MRIALITDGIWPYVLGGMQKHSYYLCKYLAANGIYVDLVHYNASTYDISQLHYFSEEEKKFIKSIIVPMPSSAKFPGHYLWNSYRHSKAIFEVIKADLKQYDFIYAKGFAAWYLINQKAAGKVDAPNIGIKFHGYEMFQKAPSLKSEWQFRLLLRKPVRSLSKKADIVFSYGGKITSIIKQIGIPASHIVELPSGVESASIQNEIRTTEKSVRFLFLGRYERRKGIEELNQAIQIFFKSNKSDCHFSFIGPISEEHQIKHPQVEYFGEIRDRDKLQAVMRNQDVLICPSWSEGMPNVILEAMSMGLAVLATDVGATSVLVNEKTGWLMQTSDPLEIVRHLKNINDLQAKQIDDKKLAARNLIRDQFTWEKLIHNLISTIKAQSPTVKK